MAAPSRFSTMTGKCDIDEDRVNVGGTFVPLRHGWQGFARGHRSTAEG